MKRERKHKRLSPGKLYAIVLATAILCCILLSVLEASCDWDWDITAGEIYTLSEETRIVLKEVEQPIGIYTLYSLGNYNKTILTLLEKYQFYCKNIIVSNIDPMNEALRIKEMGGVEESVGEGALIVRDEQTGRIRVINADELYMTYDGETYFLAENRLTDAIRYVRTGEIHRILMTVGHRETDAAELDKFVKRMTMCNYIVTEYDYLHSTAVPDPETDIILSVSPKEDLTENERESIEAFVAAGGTYILLYDYAEYDAEQGELIYAQNELKNWSLLVRTFRIRLGKGVIIGENALQTGFRDTALELRGTDGKTAVFSECTYLEGLSETASYSVTPLYMTEADCTLKFPTGVYETYQKAPYAVAMLSERDGGGCAAVFATSSFIGDTELTSAGNESVLDNVLEKSFAGCPQNVVAPKRAATDELSINSMLVKAVLTIFVLVLLPCGILALGIALVRRRKIRGGME